MKIAVIGTRGIPNIPGGVESHCQELYPRLVTLGHDVIVVCRSAYISKNHQKSYLGVKLKSIFSPKIKSFEAIVHSFLAVLWIKTQKVDILHVHAVGPGLIVPLARILGMKVVLTHHGQDYERQKWNWLAKSVLRMGEMLGSRFSNSVIAISEVIDDLLQEKYSINNSVLIYNGVTKLPIIPRSSYLNELGIGSEPYVVAVARFVPEKGLHDLLSAMSEPQFPDINVVLVGDSDHPNTYSEKLKEEALNKGVRLTGFISGDRLAEVFSNASLFVMPSYHEGLPISLLEAINYKLPVLVSDIKANLEVGLPEECYFPVGDSKKIAEKLGSAIDINLDYESLSCKYNWDDIAEKTNRLYLNIG